MKPNTNAEFWGETKTALYVTFQDGRSCIVRYDGMIFPAGETEWDDFWDGAVCTMPYGKIWKGMQFQFKRERDGKTCTYTECPPGWVLGDLVNEVVLIKRVSEYGIDGKVLEAKLPW